jgi:hypothetical protein
VLVLHDLGTYSPAELAEPFGVGRSTVYRTIQRMRPKAPEPERSFAPTCHLRKARWAAICAAPCAVG